MGTCCGVMLCGPGLLLSDADERQALDAATDKKKNENSLIRDIVNSLNC